MICSLECDGRAATATCHRFAASGRCGREWTSLTGALVPSSGHRRGRLAQDQVSVIDGRTQIIPAAQHLQLLFMHQVPFDMRT